jgi:hypothetical protein
VNSAKPARSYAVIMMDETPDIHPCLFLYNGSDLCLAF